jgi:hypothetical protein
MSVLPGQLVVHKNSLSVRDLALRTSRQVPSSLANNGRDEVFKRLVPARVIEPTSKLDGLLDHVAEVDATRTRTVVRRNSCVSGSVEKMSVPTSPRVSSTR